MWMAAWLVHWRRVHWRAGADWFLEHLARWRPRQQPSELAMDRQHLQPQALLFQPRQLGALQRGAFLQELFQRKSLPLRCQLRAT